MENHTPGTSGSNVSLNGILDFRQKVYKNDKTKSLSFDLGLDTLCVCLSMTETLSNRNSFAIIFKFGTQVDIVKIEIEIEDIL